MKRGQENKHPNSQISFDVSKLLLHVSHSIVHLKFVFLVFFQALANDFHHNTFIWKGVYSLKIINIYFWHVFNYATTSDEDRRGHIQFHSIWCK
jgi:hypothetical protein